MKRFNLISILILFFSLLNVQCIVGQYYTYEYNGPHDLVKGLPGSEKKTNLDISLEYPSDQLYFEGYLSDNVTTSHKITVLGKEYELNTDRPMGSILGIKYEKEGNDPTSDDAKKEHIDFDKSIKNITFSYYRDGNKTISIRNIKVRMAPHILLNTPSTNDLGKVEIGDTKSIDIDFKSFLTSTSGNLTVTTDNPNNFLINGKNTEITICGGNILEKLNENTKNFQVVYSANKDNVGESTANIIIKDKGNQNSDTIKITATCIKKANTINWNGINTQIPIGESVSLDNVTATSNGNITFTSSDTTIIKVENNQLIALKDGNVTIKAEVAESDKYRYAESTLDFEATKKTIQNIVWNQDFYLLKVGDPDTTLTAKATDKETGIENGNLIEYSVSEGGESVVTITNGVLHIVGKGQTSIIAHQRGDETYAATFLKKTVIVREVSTDCSGEYALVVTEQREEGCDDWCWSTQKIDVTYQLPKRGDKLSFTTDCSGATVSRQVKVTDQNGNIIYDGGFGEVKDRQLSKDVTALKFFVQGTLRIRLSNIFVTQASYLETTTESINYAGAEIDKQSHKDIIFNWANQPDMMWATIEDDKDSVFSVDQKTYIFGGTCGQTGTSTITTFFEPKKEGNYSANLVIYRGEGVNQTKMTTIPITATAIKTPQFITWEQDLSRIKKGERYTLSATSSSGLAITYKSSDENVAKIEGNVLTVSGVGNVTITALQKGNDAYEPATPISKNCITYDDQSITWIQSEFNKTLRIDDVITLNATASSNLGVTYASSNSSVATVSGNKLTIVGAGEVTITASQSGSENYNPAKNITKTITTYQYNVSKTRSIETAYNYVKLEWDAIYEADSYNIYEGDNLLGTTTETNITITGVEYGKTHTYTIKTNDDGSNTKQSVGSNIPINIPAYPTVKDLSRTETQNKASISWAQEDRIANHSYTEYHILVYKDGILIKDTSTTNTSITLEDLINATSYEVKVGVKYQYELNGTHSISPDKTIENQWIYTSFSTKDPLTEAPYNESYTGVINYKGAWYYVNINNDINITSNPMPIKPGYPCNYLTFKALTDGLGALSTGNSVGVKQDDEHTYTTETWGFSNEEHEGKTEIETTTSALSIFMNSGSATEISQLKVRNIWLTIEPHILLRENRYVKNLSNNSTKTATTTAEIDFGEIEIDYNKQVNVNFKSFLSVGNITATITADKDNVFTLNNDTKELHIAGNNILEATTSNDHSFSITFNPNIAKNEEYSGTLVIKDDRHTVEITLKGKCIKRTPEITWVNDKYISLNEFLFAAATSTCGNVRYELVDTNNDKINIDNDLNLLKGEKLGEAEIIAIVDESDKWNGAKDTVTFTVTDKIIQAIRWEQDFATLQTINEIIDLSAKAITRETEEENGNEITYSITDESIAKIVDGNKLQVVGSGYTYITAHQQGDDEYAPTYMTKLVFVIKTTGSCENYLALEAIEEITYGDGGILSSGFNWGPFEFEKELTTLGDKLSFKTTKVADQQLLNTTGDYLIITDDLGNLVYNSNLGKTETDIQLPDSEAKKLIFTLGGNLKVSISDIKVTPAKYITTDKNSIAFSETKVDNRAIEEIDFDWANQSDLIRATIEDDAAGVFSIDNKTAIFGDSDCGKYGTSTVKVIFSPKEKTDYTANLVLYVGKNPEPKKIPITGRGEKAEQTIYWLNIAELTTADKEVNLANTSASTQQPITYTVVSDENNVVKINEDSTITIVGEGTFSLKAQQSGNNSYESTDTTEVKVFTASIGNLIFDNKEKDNEWTTVRNWKPDSRLNLKRNITPDENVKLEIAAPLIIENDEDIVTEKELSISSGSITIAPKGKLKAKVINSSTANNITLEANENGSAILLFTNDEDNKVNATIELYSLASSDGLRNGEAGNFKDPKWQYLGVATESVSYNMLNTDGTSNWVYRWDETQNATSCWAEKLNPNTSDLSAWIGYCLAQEKANTYSYSGTLMNEDHTYTLTYTAQGEEYNSPDLGNNLITNSYAAPIDITTLSREDFINAEATIYIYNTGSYIEWNSNNDKVGFAPGQFISIPVESADALNSDDYPKTIASGQAFFVVATAPNASLSIDYEENVYGTEKKENLKRSRGNSEYDNIFNTLKIQVTSENSNDRLYLLENENATNGFDNGYDANKIFDNPNGPQIYATTTWGYTSINCDSSFVNQSIGFVANSENEIYTMTFDVKNLHTYDQLWLLDTETKLYIDILNEEVYQFFASTLPNNDRFYITTSNPNAPQGPTTEIESTTSWNDILAQKEPINLFSIEGKLIATYDPTELNEFKTIEMYLNSQLPSGVYIMKGGNKTIKLMVK